MRSGPGHRPLLVLAGVGALQALTLLVHLVRGKIAALTLGPEGVGILGVLDPLVQAVAHVFSLGLPIAALKFLSETHGRGASPFAAVYFGFMRRVLAGSALGTGLALALVLLWPGLAGPALQPYLGLLALSLLGVPLVPLRDLLTNTLAAARSLRSSATLALWVAAGATTGALVSVLARGGVTGFLSGTLVGSGAVLLITAARLPRALGFPPSPGVDDAAAPRAADITSTALVLWAAFLCYPVAEFVARDVVLTRFGPVQAGLLQAGLGLAGLPALLLGPATALYLAPLVNQRSAPGPMGRAAMAFLTELALATALLALPLVLFPQLALRLLYAPSFERAAGPLVLLAVGQSLRVLAGVFYVFLMGQDDVKAYGLLVAASQVLFALLAWRLGATGGVRGVAIAYAIENAVLFLSTGARAAWRHGVRPPGQAAAFVVWSVVLLPVAALWCSVRPAQEPAGALLRLGLGLALVASLFVWRQRAAVEGGA